MPLSYVIKEEPKSVGRQVLEAWGRPASRRVPAIASRGGRWGGKAVAMRAPGRELAWTRVGSVNVFQDQACITIQGKCAAQ